MFSRTPKLCTNQRYQWCSSHRSRFDYSSINSALAVNIWLPISRRTNTISHSPPVIPALTKPSPITSLPVATHSPLTPSSPQSLRLLYSQQAMTHKSLGYYIKWLQRRHQLLSLAVIRIHLDHLPATDRGPPHKFSANTLRANSPPPLGRTSSMQRLCVHVTIIITITIMAVLSQFNATLFPHS